MVRTAHPYRLIPSDPIASRMDSAHRRTVAFLWKSHSMLSDATMRFFFRDGVLRTTAEVRSAFPKGTSSLGRSPFWTPISAVGAATSSSSTAVGILGLRSAQERSAGCHTPARLQRHPATAPGRKNKRSLLPRTNSRAIRCRGPP